MYHDAAHWYGKDFQIVFQNRSGLNCWDTARRWQECITNLHRSCRMVNMWVSCTKILSIVSGKSRRRRVLWGGTKVCTVQTCINFKSTRLSRCHDYHWIGTTAHFFRITPHTYVINDISSQSALFDWCYSYRIVTLTANDLIIDLYRKFKSGGL